MTNNQLVAETCVCRPILFSGPMVNAILHGLKTQTRRLVKPIPPPWIDELHGDELSKRAPYDIEDDDQRVCGWGFQDDHDQHYRFPYGKIGDQLWVRETFAVCADSNIFYKADGKPDPWDGVKWKPSIHMPRLASRITLEITDVRVERLNDITDADALAEGVANERQRDSTWYAGKAVSMFRDLWESINGEDSWNQNPWVWAITFKRIGGPERGKD